MSGKLRMRRPRRSRATRQPPRGRLPSPEKKAAGGLPGVRVAVIKLLQLVQLRLDDLPEQLNLHPLKLYLLKQGLDQGAVALAVMSCKGQSLK